MDIEWQPLQSREISLLQSPKTLYVFDLRGPNVIPWLEIPDFWKYENILPWILEKRHVIINEDYRRLRYPNDNKYLVAPKTSDARVSLIERIPPHTLGNFSALWMGVPHRAADLLADRFNLPLNYSFVDFKIYNDKYAQKRYFDGLTPEWKEIHSLDSIESYWKENSDWFLKRRYGSGGWQVLDLARTSISDLERALSRSTDWYVEQKIEGDVYSIQCLRLPKENITHVFGLVRQRIEDGTHFVGGRILPLSDSNSFIHEQIQQTIQKMESLLKNYEGFYGIDFIMASTQKIYILEANVRMTAMTIPVLVANDLKKNFNFLEDIEMSQVAVNDIVITEDLVRKAVDILRPYNAKYFSASIRVASVISMRNNSLETIL